MTSTLHGTQLAALFGAMVVLAAMPSISVLAVTSRAAASGFRSGAWCALGVVAGDLMYIAVALAGWVGLAGQLAPWWGVLRWVAAGYLIVLGVATWRSAGRVGQSVLPPSGGSSFMAGLLITLADQKAIFFYLGFFPAFFAVESLTLIDGGWIVLTAVVGVGGVKLLYAALAYRLGAFAGGRWAARLTRLAACVLFAAGGWLLIRG
jgi:threonine/homoserine/homoserine lactone efflux protein